MHWLTLTNQKSDNPAQERSGKDGHEWVRFAIKVKESLCTFFMWTNCPSIPPLTAAQVRMHTISYHMDPLQSIVVSLSASCIPIYDPVCGSNRKVYLNQCTMQKENCKSPVKKMPLQFCVGDNVDKL